MASVKINIREIYRLPKELKKDLLGKIKKAESRWVKPAIDLSKELVDKSIEKGISPVKGGGAQTGNKARFEKYSEAYQKMIRRKIFPNKKIRPVNLELSGKMRRSLKGRRTKDGFYLFYSDKKANYHSSEGVGKKRVVRRMLPERGTNEELSRTITKPLVELFVKILRQI
jgi:hypothetical protein